MKMGVLMLPCAVSSTPHLAALFGSVAVLVNLKVIYTTINQTPNIVKVA